MLDAKRRPGGDDAGFRNIAAVQCMAGKVPSPGSFGPAAIGLAAIVPHVALRIFEALVAAIRSCGHWW